MNWIYNNKEITKLEDFGEPTPFGFIYEIEHIPSGKKYIGKKYLVHTLNKKLTKTELSEITGRGRRPKTKPTFKESDWKTYWGSSKELIELKDKEPESNFKRTILTLVPNKKLLTYYETKYLFIREVLERPKEYFNRDILGKFHTIDFEI